jgi:hypothetical protein
MDENPLWLVNNECPVITYTEICDGTQNFNDISRLESERNRGDASQRRQAESIEERMGQLDRKVTYGLRDLINNKEHLKRDIQEVKLSLSRLSVDVKRRSASAPRIQSSSSSLNASPPRRQCTDKDKGPNLARNARNSKSKRSDIDLPGRSKSAPQRSHSGRYGASPGSITESLDEPSLERPSREGSQRGTDSNINNTSFELPTLSDDLLYLNDVNMQEESHKEHLDRERLASTQRLKHAPSSELCPEVDDDDDDVGGGGGGGGAASSVSSSSGSLPSWWAGVLARKRAAEERGARAGAPV